MSGDQRFATEGSPIAEPSTEYDTRDHILHRVVTVAAGAPTGYQATAPAAWDVSALARAWGAP